MSMRKFFASTRMYPTQSHRRTSRASVASRKNRASSKPEMDWPLWFSTVFSTERHFAMTHVTQTPAATEVATGVLSASGEDEIRTRGTGKPVRRFSKPVLSATQPPLRVRVVPPIILADAVDATPNREDSNGAFDDWGWGSGGGTNLAWNRFGGLVRRYGGISGGDRRDEGRRLMVIDVRLGKLGADIVWWGRQSPPPPWAAPCRFLRRRVSKEGEYLCI